MPIERLILVDAMAVIYRAFHAIPSLSNRQGLPTNALFGFIKMLRQLAKVWKPSHWAVVFDGGLPAERMQLLPEYKAQRAPMPDELRAQLPLCDDYLDRAGICRVRCDGEEADDVLASLAAAAEGDAIEVLIASSDKDLFQLVSDRVRMIPVAGDVSVRMGPEEVRAKTGVEPGQIVDWLALIGDTADNIPGVPSVGAKTAAKLLGEFGTAERVLAGVGETVSPRLRALLIEHTDAVRRNLRLVRLRRDVPVEKEWNRCAFVKAPADRVGPFFREMGFDSLLGELEQAELFRLEG